MTPRGGRVRPALIGLGLALGFALGSLAPRSTASAASKSSRVPTIVHKSRSFRIPFNVDPSDRPRLKEVQLWVSEDSGFSWKTVSRTTPDRPAFTFRSSRDGEYWFAVRTLDSKGQVYPAAEEKVEPSMKVIVDTTAPSLVLEPDARRGSLASVRWEVRDENLDLNSLVIEYQMEGGREWRQVPIRRPALIGSESWEAGTAEPLKVRASVADKAGNVTEAVVALPEGTADRAGSSSTAAAEFSAPPISQISSGPTLPPRDLAPAGAAGSAERASNPVLEPFPFPPAATSPTAAAPFGDEPDPFVGAQPAASSAAPSPVPESGTGQTQLVPSPRFPLQYEVDDAGPSGPASVELWVTADGGRSWIRRGEDPDRVSPFQVDLGGEGTFGMRMVARAASGLGDQPPAPGDAPHMWVEVDSTPPSVQLNRPVVGKGANLGKVAITWRAADLHLSAKPVLLSWRPDQPGSRWQPITEPIENSGKFIWSVPTDIPPRFHVRIDVVDTVGNRASGDTSEMGPITVDRTRPRGRIIGLDPSARVGPGPGAAPLR